MNEIKQAILDFYDEVIASLDGADYQADNHKDFMDMIYANVADDKNKVLKKYGFETE